MANRFRDLRRSTLSWCRRTRISASNAAHSPPYGFPQTPPVVIVHAVTEFIGEYLLRHPVKVWRDPSDRISALRIVTLMCLFAPLSKAIYDSDAIRFDARPITELIHRTGDWALIFLLVALAVRPLSRILRFNQLLDVRRMIGVGAFAYAAAHFTLYIVDLMFDWREIASEIVHRNRLTLGFVALLGLTALALTSTNGMVRRLGIRRWQRLHQAIYLIGVLVLIHYFLRFKLIESTPTFATGLFGWLIGYRSLVWWCKTGNELPTWMLLALSVMVAALTFIAEAIALGIQANVSPLRVLQSAFDFDLIRPGWLVLGAGLIVVALDFACARFAKQRRAARQVERVLAARLS
jgi:methionine sulfoxide reductase heme-binding subunit